MVGIFEVFELKYIWFSFFVYGEIFIKKKYYSLGVCDVRINRVMLINWLLFVCLLIVIVIDIWWD